MNIDGKAYRTIWLDEADRLHVIDQHVLPHRFETATITSFSALCDAIRNMLVRGAGLIGATAGYGMWLAACEAPAKDTEDFDTFMSDAATALKRTRPTASNLAWAVDRQLAAMTRGSSPEEKRHIAKVTAQAIADEDAEACKRIGEHGKTLLEALAADFQGYEAVERMLTEDAPKWGNDDPEADAMVIDLTSFIIKKIAAFRGLLGNQKLPALYPVSSNVPQGMAVGALPSGRRAFRPIAEGCSPCQGADRTGPTAVLRSLGKLPHTCIDGGTLLNLKFTPASVEGEAGRIRLSAFLKSFLDLDVFHVQFNVVGHEVLRCAQAHPEEYKSLLVRVAGYSAYFVELSREVQDDILSRTAHAL